MVLKPEEKRSCLAITMRPMRKQDIKDVYAIEVVSYPKPWPLKSFIDELSRNRYARYIVATVPEDRIVGYSGMWLISGEVHITNVAVDPGYRRRKIAEQLLINHIDYSLKNNARTIYLEVRRYNLPAQRLYARYLFGTKRVRERYYPDNKEDAIELRVENIRDRQFLVNFRDRRKELLDELGLESFQVSPVTE